MSGSGDEARRARDGRQAAALPYRRRQGKLEILLITSRETRRWIIPKGKIDPGMSRRQAAAQEALEEAGVIGEIADKSLGSFVYAKRRATGLIEMIEADVFALAVTGELSEWQESHQRERRWFVPTAAASSVDETDLALLIREFAAGLSD